MSEKRFYMEDGVLKDGVTGEAVSLYGIDDLLNEQQATIEQLKAQLREKEQDEQLYANEILELREANKEFIQFKELGGDY